MTLVSVVVPCRNEQDRILFLLQALHEQTYPVQDMEVVIADAMSSDLTPQRIREFMQVHPDLRIMIIENPQKTIPAGLNLGAQSRDWRDNRSPGCTLGSLSRICFALCPIHRGRER